MDEPYGDHIMEGCVDFKQMRYSTTGCETFPTVGGQVVFEVEKRG